MATFYSAKKGSNPAEAFVNKKNNKKKSLLKTGEKSGIALALALFIYGLSAWDIPLASCAFGFIILYVHIVIERSGVEKLHIVSNILKGFSITLFIGSFFMAFL